MLLEWVGEDIWIFVKDDLSDQVLRCLFLQWVNCSDLRRIVFFIFIELVEISKAAEVLLHLSWSWLLDTGVANSEASSIFSRLLNHLFKHDSLLSCQINFMVLPGLINLFMLHHRWNYYQCERLEIWFFLTRYEVFILCPFLELFNQNVFLMIIFLICNQFAGLNGVIWKFLKFCYHNALLDDLQVRFELIKRFLKLILELNIDFKVDMSVTILSFAVSNLVKVVSTK